MSIRSRDRFLEVFDGAHPPLAQGVVVDEAGARER
jgi:hypothetical protein